MRPQARTLALIFAALLVLAAAGCGGDSSASSGDTRPLVTFGRTGGNENKVYGLVVERGGGATLTQYPEQVKRFDVGSDKRDDLQSALNDLDIKSLKPTYQPDTPTAMGHRYSVTYQGTTVQAVENADMPGQLKSVIDKLGNLVDDEK
ncbi:MAG: hypothetical protein QOG15_1071 [Solirubrobacteraceae bacterium]|jgi:hypothetical protein|nr:hypothetical protein [Solirubrobacteraceae bacterium]